MPWGVTQGQKWHSVSCAISHVGVRMVGVGVFVCLFVREKERPDNTMVLPAAEQLPAHPMSFTSTPANRRLSLLVNHTQQPSILTSVLPLPPRHRLSTRMVLARAKPTYSRKKWTNNNKKKTRAFCFNTHSIITFTKLIHTYNYTHGYFCVRYWYTTAYTSYTTARGRRRWNSTCVSVQDVTKPAMLVFIKHWLSQKRQPWLLHVAIAHSP